MIPVIKSYNFYNKLVTIGVRKSEEDLPDLSSFLAFKSSKALQNAKPSSSSAYTYIDVKSLATAIGEFLTSPHL